MKKTEETNYALEQAKAQLESIRAMVVALTVDYDRLEELRNLEAEEMTDEEKEELLELEEAAGDCEDEEDARQRIQEDPLEVSIRSGWYAPGETPEPEEFRILLCTGGPAVQIIGELDEYKQPCRAWLQYQDWFTSWTDYIEPGTSDDILTYCREFYFGD